MLVQYRTIDVARCSPLSPNTFDQRLTLWKFDTAISWCCKLLIRSALEVSSSGWIRTSNPPVNRSDPEDRPSETKHDEDDENQ